ncbi:hypothetical protein LCGC14_2001870, partial [marine sediment metagenome]
GGIFIDLTGITAVLPIGMEYSEHVDERTNFTQEARDAAPAIFASQLSAIGPSMTTAVSLV